MFSRSILLLLLLFGAAGARAEGLSARSQIAIVYGNETCPNPVGDEIVVCARKPENERYPGRFAQRQERPSVGDFLGIARAGPRGCEPTEQARKLLGRGQRRAERMHGSNDAPMVR